MYINNYSEHVVYMYTELHVPAAQIGQIRASHQAHHLHNNNPANDTHNSST